MGKLISFLGVDGSGKDDSGGGQKISKVLSWKIDCRLSTSEQDRERAAYRTAGFVLVVKRKLRR
jgi:hypothetical protein